MSFMDEDDLPLPPAEESLSFMLGGRAESSPEQLAGNVQDSSQTEISKAPYQVLARKYRPREFSDLIGQETMVRILRRSFALNRVAHGFMLTGVRGVGKTTTARIIARALNCIGVDGKGGPTADPCGVCAECKAILADRHPDVLELDAASRTGVDDMREIIDSTRFHPMQGRMKVFIIDEVHMLSKAAFNALLKTLEEPPPQVTFVFATTELRKVPVTVLSRCQKFNLRRVPEAELTVYLEKIAQKEKAFFEKDALTLLARAAEGSVRDGLSLLDQAIIQGASDVRQMEEMLGLTGQTQLYTLLSHLLHGDMPEILELSQKLYALGVEPRALMADLMGALHQISRMKLLPSLLEGTAFSQIEKEQGSVLAAKVSEAVLGRAWQILRQGLEEIDGAPDQHQALEMVLIRLAYAAALPTPDRLAKMFHQKLQEQGTGRTISSLALDESVPRPQGGEGAGKKTEAAPAPPVPSVREPDWFSREEAHPKEAQRDSFPQNPPAETISDKLIGEPSLGSVRVSSELRPEKTQKTEAPPQSWPALLEALRERGEDIHLRTMLACAGRVVAFAPPHVSLRIDSKVPEVRQNMEDKFRRAMLTHWPDVRWEFQFVTSGGGDTLDQQREKQERQELERAAKDPLIAQCLAYWPGAVLKKREDLETETARKNALERENPTEAF